MNMKITEVNVLCVAILTRPADCNLIKKRIINVFSARLRRSGPLSPLFWRSWSRLVSRTSTLSVTALWHSTGNSYGLLSLS